MSGRSSPFPQSFIELAASVVDAPASRSRHITAARRAFDQLLSLCAARIDLGAEHNGSSTHSDSASGPSTAGTRALYSADRGGGRTSCKREEAIASNDASRPPSWRDAERQDAIAAVLLAPVQTEADPALKLVVLIALDLSSCAGDRRLLSAGLRALLADLIRGSPERDRAF